MYGLNLGFCSRNTRMALIYTHFDSLLFITFEAPVLVLCREFFAFRAHFRLGLGGLVGLKRRFTLFTQC